MLVTFLTRAIGAVEKWWSTSDIEWGVLTRASVLERWNIAGLAARLRCPSCELPVAAAPDGSGYACLNGHRMVFRDGYLVADGPSGRDVMSQRTAESFGYEWTTFDDVRPEDNVFATWYLADLRLDELAGKVGLDAGCGKGRYTRHLAPHLAVLVALDASVAIEVATRDLAAFDNVVTVRSDLRSAPFACLVRLRVEPRGPAPPRRPVRRF